MLDVIHSCDYTFFPSARPALREGWSSVIKVIGPDGLPSQYTEPGLHASEIDALDAARLAAREIAAEIREGWITFDAH